MSIPSITAWGLYLSISLSLHVPGSLSSELQTKYRCFSAEFIKDHFNPVKNPAPPFPFNPDSLTNRIISDFGVLSLMIFFHERYPS